MICCCYFEYIHTLLCVSEKHSNSLTEIGTIINETVTYR
jgi:hypothetical protein